MLLTARIGPEAKIMQEKYQVVLMLSFSDPS